MKIRFAEEGRPELINIVNTLNFNEMFADDGFNEEERGAIENQTSGMGWVSEVTGYLKQAQPGENTTDTSTRELLFENLTKLTNACSTLMSFASGKPNFSDNEKTWKDTIDLFDPEMMNDLQKRLDAYNESTNYKFISTPQMRNLYTLVRGLRTVSAKLDNIAYMETTGIEADKNSFKNNVEQFGRSFEDLENSAKEHGLSLANTAEIFDDLEGQTAKENEEISKEEKALTQLKHQKDKLSNQGENAYKDAQAEYLKLSIVEMSNEFARSSAIVQKNTDKLNHDRILRRSGERPKLSAQEQNKLVEQNSQARQSMDALKYSINKMTEDLSKITGHAEGSEEMQKELSNTRKEVSNLKPEELAARVEAAKAHAQALNVAPGKKFQVVETEHTKALDELITKMEGLKNLRQDKIAAIKDVKNTSGLSTIKERHDFLGNKFNDLQDELKTFSDKCDNTKAPSHTDEINKRIDAFLNKMNKGKRSTHRDSDEFIAMKDAMNNYKNGKGTMEDIKKAAEDYLEAKKSGMNLGTNMRHIRLAFAKELKAFATDCLNKETFVKTTAASEKEKAAALNFKKDFNQMVKDSNTAEPEKTRQNIMSGLKGIDESIIKAGASCKNASEKLAQATAAEKTKEAFKLQELESPVSSLN